MQIAHYGTGIVIVHAVVVALHALAHEKVPVSISLLQSLFIVSVIVLAPLLAMLLLWMRFYHIGILLLFCAMFGALAFGVCNHFIIFGSDRISQVPFEGWGLLFQVTSILLAITEGLGCGVSVWALLHYSSDQGKPMVTNWRNQ